LEEGTAIVDASNASAIRLDEGGITALAFKLDETSCPEERLKA